MLYTSISACPIAWNEITPLLSIDAISGSFDVKDTALYVAFDGKVSVVKAYVSPT